MRGVILGVHEGRCILTTDDQRRLEFPLSEWRSALAPVAGDAVDFTEEAGEARAIYRVLAAPLPLGAAQSATAIGAISVGCLALGFIIPLIPTIASLILGLLGAAQAKQAGDENGLLLSRIGWIGSAVMLSVGFLLVLVFGAFLLQLFAAWAAFSGWEWHNHGGSIFW